MRDRSYLFVPGDRAERFDKAMGTKASVVIIDLEYAVAPESKDLARVAIDKPLLLRAQKIMEARLQ